MRTYISKSPNQPLEWEKYIHEHNKNGREEPTTPVWLHGQRPSRRKRQDWMCRFLGWFFPARDNLCPDHMFEKALYFGGCLGLRRNNCIRVGKHLDLRLKECTKSTRGENKEINGSGKDRINDLTLTMSNSLEKNIWWFFTPFSKKKTWLVTVLIGCNLPKLCGTKECFHLTPQLQIQEIDDICWLRVVKWVVIRHKLLFC